MKIFNLTAVAIAALCSVADLSAGQNPISSANSTETPAATFDAQATFNNRCAHCHDGSVAKAPHQIKFQLIGAKAIESALNEGVMATYASDLTRNEIKTLAAYLGGESIARIPVKRCEATEIPAVKPVTAGWSLSKQGTRFIPADVAQLSKNVLVTFSLNGFLPTQVPRARAVNPRPSATHCWLAAKMARFMPSI